MTNSTMFPVLLPPYLEFSSFAGHNPFGQRHLAPVQVLVHRIGSLGHADLSPILRSHDLHGTDITALGDAQVDGFLDVQWLDQLTVPESPAHRLHC